MFIIRERGNYYDHVYYSEGKRLILIACTIQGEGSISADGIKKVSTNSAA